MSSTLSGSKSVGRERLSLTSAQTLIGISLIASGLFGYYMLATDNSLWILGVSHAYALVVLAAVDLVIAGLCLLRVRYIYLTSMLWAVFTIFAQLADIYTGPQYNMTIQYFASYLFGLWAFDAMLAIQFVVLVVGVLGTNAWRTQYNANSKSPTGKSRSSCRTRSVSQ